MSRIVACLWFDGRAEDAANFYAATFPDSHVGRVTRAPADYPAGRAGDVLSVEFTVLGMDFLGLNGGPGHPFTDAVSFQVYTESQEETDRLWNAVVSDGGAEIACGWCRDKFGLCWQITPRRLMVLLSDPDRECAGRVMQAMMDMTRIDIAALERAAGA